MGRAFEEVSRLVKANGLHDRVAMSLVDATFGYRVRSGRYQEENQVSDVVASRDMRRLCELGLLEPVGEKRGRYYVAAQPLKEIYKRARADDVRAADPYEIIRKPEMGSQLALGLEAE